MLYQNAQFCKYCKASKLFLTRPTAEEVVSGESLVKRNFSFKCGLFGQILDLFWFSWVLGTPKPLIFNIQVEVLPLFQGHSIFSDVKNKTWITCILLILFQPVTGQTGKTGCQDVHSISGYSLISHVYRMMSQVGLITCITACQNYPQCFSLNFKYTYQLCELNNGSRLSAEPKYFVYSSDTVYLDNLHRPYRPCDNSPCMNDGVCISTDFYPGFKCACKEGFFGPACEGENLENRFWFRIQMTDQESKWHFFLSGSEEEQEWKSFSPPPPLLNLPSPQRN